MLTVIHSGQKHLSNSTSPHGCNIPCTWPKIGGGRGIQTQNSKFDHQIKRDGDSVSPFYNGLKTVFSLNNLNFSAFFNKINH